MTRTPDPDQLAVLLALVANNLRHEIAQHLAAHPHGTAYDNAHTTGGAGSDPTVTAALANDPARHDLAAYDDAGKTLHRNLLIWLSLSEKYLPARQPRRATIAADTRPCHLHDRAGATTQHHQGAHRTDLGSFLDKPLPQPADVCEACYQFARRAGRVPTNDELVRHDRSGRWSLRSTRTSVFSAEQIVGEWEQRGDVA